MFGKLTVCFVKSNFVTSVLVHAGFQIVATQDSCHTAKVFERIDMCGRPAFLIHGKERFHIAIAAVGQRCHEYICGDCFSCICVDYSGCIACPVHLKDFTRLVIQMQSGVGFGDIIVVILIELCGLIRKLSGIPAGLTCIW